MAKGKYKHWITDTGLKQIEEWAKAKQTDERIAGNIGIATSTFYDWCKKYPEISEAIKKGRKPVIQMVVSALEQRAEGYKDTVRTWERRQNPETGEWEMVLTKEEEKIFPADVGAIAFYLKNTDPDNWKDRKDLDINGLSGEQSKIDGILEQLSAKGGD